MEAGEYGLTRGTRFVGRCLEVVAVAGLLWVSWSVFGGVGFFSFFFSFFFLRTHTACCKMMTRAPCLVYLSTSNDAVFCLKGKKVSSYRGAYRAPFFK